MSRLKFEPSLCGLRLDQPGRSAFTLKELLACIAVIGALLAISLPAIQSARETQRRVRCVSNLKEIGMALLNYEYGWRSLPPISSNIDSIADVPGDSSATTNHTNSSPGSADSPGAGYSWMVQILPQIDEGTLYQSIVNKSKKLTLSAFDPSLQFGSSGRDPHCATLQLDAYICPSFVGGRTVDTSARVVGTISGAIESGTVPPNYVGGIATANGAKGIALSNYNAMLGTHIDDRGPAAGPYPLKSASLPNSNNGVMMFRGVAFHIGRKLAGILDGTAKTIMVAETRERRFSSWYDGTMNWVVAARHSNPAAGDFAITAATNNIDVNFDDHPMSGLWTIGTDGTSATGGSALNYGPTAASPTATYLPTAALTDPDITAAPPGRLWGPSSQHKGGVVNHVFADAHVEGIADNIDANVYLWLVTRNGGEQIPMPPRN